MRCRALLLLACALPPRGAGAAEVKGIIAAAFTPKAANGTLNLPVVAAQAEYFQKTGVDGVLVSGTTGESVDLSPGEREALAAEWVRQGRAHGIAVVVHVGDDSVSVARRLAAHAQAVGADAVCTMPPTYIKPKTVRALVDTVAFIADGAPQLPMLYYHIPEMTGVTFNMIDFLKGAQGRIPTLAGIKYTHSDLLDLQMCANYVGDGGKNYTIFFGHEQYLASAMLAGAVGAVGSTFNFNGELIKVVLRSMQRGDTAAARAAQLDYANLQAALHATTAAYPDEYAYMAYNNLVAVDVGFARLPYEPPSAALTADVRKTAAQWCPSVRTLRPAYCAQFM